MRPEEIEDMLYHRAVRTKIRPPFAERLSNLGYNRIITSGMVAGAALIFTLAMNGTPSSTDSGFAAPSHSQVTDTEPKKHQPSYQVPPVNTDPMTASLAMSRIAN